MIGHVDADCFYVSAERVRTPSLAGLPVGVLGNQGAAVIAKSYELKKHGVKTGEPIWEAVEKCPDAIFIKRDFRWYEVLSRQLLEQLRAVSPLVEYYSIDEMFFSADGMTLETTRELQERIRTEIGIPVSIGISLTKTIAKLFSDTSKPYGCVVVTDREEIDALLRRLPVGEISGVGSRSEVKLKAHGIETCLDFAQADRRLIRRLLTVTGERLWFELRGEVALPILTSRPAHKMLGRGGSLGEATQSRERLTAWIARNVERLIEELDYHQFYVERIILMMEEKGGKGWGARSTFPSPTASFLPMLETLKALLARAPLNLPITGMEILADKLCRRDRVQLSFLGLPDPQELEVAAIKRRVNQTVGRFAVRSGETALLEIYDDEASSYDICDVRGKICF